MLVALYFAVQPYLKGFDTALYYINLMMVFMGLGISFSTLQDTRKTQNEFSRKIWEDPRKARVFIAVFTIVICCLIITGLVGLIGTKNATLTEISLGTVVLAIGMIGMLKSMLEMFENHRKDKHE
jgi:uncharacterized membrane protein